MTQIGLVHTEVSIPDLVSGEVTGDVPFKYGHTGYARSGEIICGRQASSGATIGLNYVLEIAVPEYS
jgi:hypothetical protein